ncbi:hypothetical protein [Leptospira alstonii]|uniref:Uncharacterized protein n=2 Tax=Leptospira alstonii TaxID=28452 RepID=M6CY19_9LEPT|nr:hypothetical protein [Leptospira alstonii]EMJ96782.1 hypothetical protein LEP1GSC194_4291 [Leptospira alstonii serovar Sichuan str. 79601]EQA78706.1 hypothetical protein LEP1GSC193_1677 [Leptospira alstonii serovar Pingchang str. 80-412]
MSSRLTLEGDETLPEDFRITKVYGKYIPKTELNGELSGDFYVERIDGYSPQIAQLNGLDDAKHSEFFGSLVHDDAIPITLSGAELGAWGALFKALKFKSPRMPVMRGFKLNTRGLSRGLGNATKSMGKVGKEIGKGAKNYIKAHQKAFKDIGKGLGKGLKGAGKLVGQIAEGGMGLLQSMGQGQGEQPDEEPQDEQLDETQNNFEDPGTFEETENYSEEPEEIPTDESMEEVNGELGFLPQAMMAAGTAGQIFNSINSMQQSNAAAKHARSMDKLNAFSSILRPQPKAVAKKPAAKKAVSNSSFSNPKLAQTPEGGLKLSYSNRNLDNAPDSGGGSGEDKDKKNLMYIGAIAALGLVIYMNKGRK